ncbi:MAG TPA: hypothetical protein PK637_09425 [Flavobacteriales bacterium]|nr:hypothetical protein [Flavobacteriales bacterium]HRE96974.1 hypothetical protein [Flavobacteriales bacterium]HRJ37923.1 hypothetical protein [Flavobacteriales bacterium]
MKKVFLLLFLVASIGASAQFKLDEADYGTKFKTLFDAAKKRFATEKTGAKTTISEGDFVAKYETTIKISGASYSRIIVDKDGIVGHDSRFVIGDNKDEAKKVLASMITLIKANMPPKFILRETWDDKFEDMAQVVEFDSDVFAQQAKQPSAKTGIRKIEGKFVIDLTVYEPIFK